MQTTKLTTLVFIVMLAAGCGSDVSPTDSVPEPGPLAAGTIDGDGGELDGGDIMLTVPPGAFDLGIALAIYTGDDDPPFGGTEPVYRITGLPEELGVPVELRFRNPGVRTDEESALLFIGEERDSRPAGRILSWTHVASRDSVGWTIAQLVRGAYDLGDRADGDLQVTVSTTTKQIPLDTYEHFQVYYDSNELEPEFPLTVLEEFESAFDDLVAMGFTFGDQDTIWPLQVHLRRPGYGGEGECIIGPWGRGHFNINPSLKDNSEILDNVVLHELFHNAQDYFDTRHPRDWTTVSQERLWLDEATAAYLESSIDTDYNPLGLHLDNYLAPLLGISDFPAGDRALMGYGMSSFIRYLIEHQGEERLLAIYEAFFQYGKITDALMAVMDPPLGEWCAELQRQVVLNELYSFDPLGHVWNGWSGMTLLLDGSIGSNVTGTMNIRDFGSGVWTIRSYGEAAENGDLRIRVSGSSDPSSLPLELILYGKPDEELPVYLAQDTDELIYDDWSGACQTYPELLLHVIRPHGTGPDYDNLTDVDLQMTVIEEAEEMPPFDSGRFQLNYEAHLGDGTVIPGDLLSQQYAAGSMSGNNFSAVWDSIGVHGVELSGHFDVNMALDPLRVVSWSYEWRWTYPDDPDTYKIYQAEGGAVPRYGDSEYYTAFRLDDEAVCASLTHLYFIEVAGGVVEAELDDWACNNLSYLNIYLKTGDQ